MPSHHNQRANELFHWREIRWEAIQRLPEADGRDLGFSPPERDIGPHARGLELSREPCERLGGERLGFVRTPQFLQIPSAKRIARRVRRKLIAKTLPAGEHFFRRLGSWRQVRPGEAYL